jgi:hypothetical protein
LGAKFGAPAIVVAAAAARWLRRRRRGLAGLVAIEIVVFSVVLYITVNDNLYGGPFPAALLSQPGATGASGVAEHLARAPRLLGLWIDRDVGLLRWAPFAALAFAAIWLLVRSRRERQAIALSEQVDVEVTAAFLVAICGAAVAFATFLAPTIAGPWFAGHELASVLPAMGRFPPTGVNPQLVWNVRNALDAEGFGHVKIVASGGFTPARIRAFEDEGVPVDAYGIGGSAVVGGRRYDFVADVVQLAGAPRARAGRDRRPNDRLERVK